MIKRTMIAMAVGAALAAPAFADQHGMKAQKDQPQAQKQQQKTQSSRAQMNWQDMRASDLMGKEVVNRQDEELGEIKDLVIDTQSGRVRYAVLEFGGILGIGEKLFAFPVERFSPGQERDKLVLNIDKDKLEARQGFDKDKWPNLAGDNYWSGVDRDWQIEAAMPKDRGREDGAVAGGTLPMGKVGRDKDAAQERQAKGEQSRPAKQSLHLVRASDLTGKNLKDGAGKDVGEVQDLVVNLGSGDVRYAIIDVEDKDRHVALPLNKLQAKRGEGNETRFTVDAKAIAQARPVPEDMQAKRRQ